MKLDTMLFDLDGTLIDSIHLIKECFRLTLKEHVPETEYSESDILEMIGPPLSVTFAPMADTEEKLAAMITSYRKYYKELEFSLVSVFPHVVETLRQLKEKGFYLGVVTTKFRESAEPSLRYFEIERYLDVLIGLDDAEKHKPHPEPILKALDGLPHHQVLMVGDAPSDIMAGKNAGVLTCGVSWSIKKAELEATKPDYWITDFRELIAIANQINEEEEN